MWSDANSLPALLALVRQTIAGHPGRPANRDALVLRGAAVLREVCPGSPLYLCRAGKGSDQQVRVVDGQGTARNDWVSLFPTSPPEASPCPLPEGTGPEEFLLATHTRILPDGLLAGAGIAIPQSAADETTTVAGAILECVSSELLLQLIARGETGDAADSLTNGSREVEKADLGELAGPMVHTFNNLLNNLQLHLTILEHSASLELLATIATLRRHVGSNTEMIKEFERYRRASRAGAEVVDVNGTIREACEAVEREEAGELPARPGERACKSVAVASSLAPDLPSVRGDAADLRRVGRWLVRNAKRAAVANGSAVEVQTERVSDKVLIGVLIRGVTFAPDQLKHLFEPARTAPGGMSALELAACESICRRALLGKIRAQQVENDTVIQLELPAAR